MRHLVCFSFSDYMTIIKMWNVIKAELRWPQQEAAGFFRPCKVLFGGERIFEATRLFKKVWWVYYLKRLSESNTTTLHRVSMQKPYNSKNPLGFGFLLLMVMQVGGE
jgi:hypothetical protein